MQLRPYVLPLILLAACTGKTGTTWTATTQGPAPTAVEPEPAASAPTAGRPDPGPTPAAIADAKAQLVGKYGEAQRARIERGVDQVASLWRASDGDLAALCVAQFVAEPAQLDALFARLQDELEQINGHGLELGRALRWNTEVDTGPMLPVDELLSAYDPTAHVSEDLFASKVAFAILLNFPLTKLADRIRDGASYSRRQWAEARLASFVDSRIPGDVAQAASAADAAAEQYIAGYNIWMHHVLGADGKRAFPSGMRLISHWNLRDEIKADYAAPDGLAKQRTIAAVMDRITTQTIPAAVIDNPHLDWDPVANTVSAAPAADVEADAPEDRPTTPSTEREPDTRFAQVRAHLVAALAIDPYTPTAPSLIERAFEGAEMPEDRVRQVLTELLESPLAAEAAKDIAKRLGRPLEPFDLWYEFGADPTPEAELDAITRKRYPTAEAFAADLPRIFVDLGFTKDRARYLADHITVDSSRGAGHAMGAQRKGDKAHLRTRVEPGGMNYKGYNIAVHELGHNVEQTFSLYDIDYWLLEGVPNTAFTEALAFLFQARDLELLGRPRATGEADRLRVLDAFWNAREIAGSALVELDVWTWLYAHPAATATEIRDATLRIARDTWNRYYAPTLGGKDTTLLAIYSHTISTPLYLFNYVLGHLIAFQVEEHVAGKDKATFATEYERVSRLGDILPDLWMTQATGKPVGTEPLLKATARALGHEE